MSLSDREIPDALGCLCEGRPVGPELLEAVLAALRGPVETERGLRRYYADLDTLMLSNVDTEEGIWSLPADGLLRGHAGEVLADLEDLASARAEALFPLWAVLDPVRMASWEQAMQRASNPERQRWARLHKRLLRPLLRRLRRDGLLPA